jgi:hypothetical protein
MTNKLKVIEPKNKQEHILCEWRYQLIKETNYKITVYQYLYDVKVVYGYQKPRRCSYSLLMIKGSPKISRDIFTKFILNLIIKFNLTADVLVIGYYIDNGNAQDVSYFISKNDQGEDIFKSSEVDHVLLKILDEPKERELKHNIIYNFKDNQVEMKITKIIDLQTWSQFLYVE